ncbi:acetylpolyamine amidohydrolase [Steroidobacter agaridevorans]|uniref:Acetylpolyamine amidohydrolase n=1 Tax=Steroidobacter agaridevorans TaxID=2695856 RepID=A0A829YCY6_9GAMM|nr:histone deacetylase family protein [Steroidobacter agaridevorans]GFE81130.1 acetylpolyamine amidohydrolase [Steroidobacter agaridevorans]GFE88985.1 acetylpolyamine amidohydrolase [Steroidobacter agaridevorans]
MKIIYSDRHRLHAGDKEMYRGQLVPCFEKPERADFVYDAVKARNFGPILEPKEFAVAAIERVHAPRYIRFLEKAWDLWSAQGYTNDALPAVWPVRGHRTDIEPDHFAGKFGLYSYDSGTPFTAGTWAAAKTGADIALTAQQIVGGGERAAFALSRPPGHHSGPDFFGGYCFVNNAAVAAQAFRDNGAKRVVVLDVDYHHGNGTQTIFYDRSDVMFLSIHGDPRTEYPFFLGHADETGSGEGLGYNKNYPLPAGSSNALWFDALGDAVRRINEFKPDALVISLGVDTFADDPISKFQLREPEYLKLGAQIAALNLPTVFILEGGYAVAEIGHNVAHVLQGFEDAAK